MKNFPKNIVHNHCIRKAFSAKNRGLSTVVSSVLIMSAVAIMGVMLIGWANSSLFAQQANLNDSLDTRMNKLNEDLSVEHVWFGDDPYVVNVTMSNIGSIGFNVTEVRIQNSTGDLLFSYTDGGVVPRDSFSIQESYIWADDETVDFSITTHRGNIFTAQVVTDE